MSELLDARGCLTPAAMAVLRRSAPGAAPADLAQHLAACPRCQARLLKADLPSEAGRAAPRGGPGAPGRLWRPVVFVVAILFLALAALAVMGTLSR